jgi:hypothetical protein
MQWIHAVTNKRISSKENINPQPMMQYPMIHSLLRVIRNGLECKAIVDECIDKCSQVMNLRLAIDTWRAHAENSTEENVIRRAVQKGVQYLKRYFIIICFQAYLDQTNPDQGLSEIESFAAWLKRHAEIVRMLDELEDAGAAGHKEVLLPIHVLQPGEGIALTTEVLEVVRHRRGSVLASYTILKYDHFPGKAKDHSPYVCIYNTTF